jgi:hypothetical protein
MHHQDPNRCHDESVRCGCSHARDASADDGHNYRALESKPHIAEATASGGGFINIRLHDRMLWDWYTSMLTPIATQPID